MKFFLSIFQRKKLKMHKVRNNFQINGGLRAAMAIKMIFWGRNRIAG